MEIDERQRSLLNKLYELTLRGVDGEKESAKDKLNKHLEKYGITIEEFLADKDEFVLNEVYLQYPDEARFFTQILSSEIGECELYKMTYKLKRIKDKERFTFKCPKSIFVYVVAKHEFYYDLFQKELSLFRSAFIQKNKLWKKQDNLDEHNLDELNQESREDLMRIALMMSTIENKPFAKGLISQ